MWICLWYFFLIFVSDWTNKLILLFFSCELSFKVTSELYSSTVYFCLFIHALMYSRKIAQANYFLVSLLQKKSFSPFNYTRARYIFRVFFIYLTSGYIRTYKHLRACVFRFFFFCLLFLPGYLCVRELGFCLSLAPCWNTLQPTVKCQQIFCGSRRPGWPTLLSLLSNKHSIQYKNVN